jgi:exonuclease III
MTSTNKDLPDWQFASLNVQEKYKASVSEIEEEIIKNLNVDVLAVQGLGISKFIKSRYNTPDHEHFDIAVSLGKGNQDSVAIIWRKTLQPNPPIIKKKPGLRTILLFFEDANLVIINTYVIHKGELKNKQMSFISNKVKNYKKKGKNIIIMGDFNEIANVSLDRWSNINRESTPSNTLIKKLTALKMIDTFRYLHPDKKKFSRSAIETHVINGVKTKKHIHTRIDYIFCSKHMAQDILSSDIVAEQIIHSDHRAVLAKINIAQKPDTPQTPEPSTFKKINTKNSSLTIK